MRSLTAPSALLLSVCLGACGGDDGIELAPTVLPTQGLYVGGAFTDSFSSIAMTDSQLVLENGEVWAAKGATATGAPAFFAHGTCALLEQRATVITAADGTSKVDPNSVVIKFAAGSALVAVNGAALSTASVSCVENRTVDGVPRFETASTVPAGGVDGVLLPALPASTAQPAYFNYAKAAVLADVSGSWTFSAPKSTLPRANLEIATSGAVSGINEATGCSYAGMLSPRPGGKNVFNVALTLSGCPDAGTYGGVAYSYLGTPLILNGARTPLTLFQMLAINSARTMTFHLLMQRS